MDKKEQFLDLVTQYEFHKEQTKALREELHVVLRELGVGNYIQDPVTSLVYKVTKPKGTFIEFHDIGYDRTAKPEEDRGTLSKKEAESMGFVLKK